MSKHLAAHILLYLQLTSFVFCGPLPPNHLKCERSLAGLKQEQLEEVHRQATVTTDNPNPLLSWNIQHTGMCIIAKSDTLMVCCNTISKNLTLIFTKQIGQ